MHIKLLPLYFQTLILSTIISTIFSWIGNTFLILLFCAKPFLSIFLGIILPVDKISSSKFLLMYWIISVAYPFVSWAYINISNLFFIFFRKVFK